MLDDDGKEVLGTKGYRSVNFGCAKELPQRASTSQSRKKDEEEHNAALESLQKFQNRTPQFYGDGDEGRGVGAADKGGGGGCVHPSFLYSHPSLRTGAELRARFGLPEDAPIPRPGAVDQSTTEDQEPMPPVADGDLAAATSALAAAAHITFLILEMLIGPKLPTHAETESVLLQIKKCMLVREYFGE
ncbi:hypothetical protein K438DRAFT_1969554 [Mycena galopus ATCC 62051]|nr:hypothetical protein K438DRAFT_1969554 [Mycena galopus ATCC 62051]